MLDYSLDIILRLLKISKKFYILRIIYNIYFLTTILDTVL